MPRHFACILNTEELRELNSYFRDRLTYLRKQNVIRICKELLKQSKKKYRKHFYSGRNPSFLSSGNYKLFLYFKNKFQITRIFSKNLSVTFHSDLNSPRIHKFKYYFLNTNYQ